MKNLIKYLTTTFLFAIGMMFCLNMNAKAALDMGIYQGSSAPPGTGYNKGDCSSVFGAGNQLCRFKLVASPNQFGIRISFVYIDTEKGIYQQLGDYWDIWKKDPAFSQGIKTTPANSGSKVNQSMLSLSSFSRVGYTARILSDMQYSSSWLEKKFYDKEYLGELANAMIPEVSQGMDDPYWNQFDTQFADANTPATRGLRFFIEPIRGYAASDGDFYVMTLSEFARLQAGSSVNKWTWWNYSSNPREEWLFMSIGSEFLDVGVQPIVACTDKAKCTANDVYTITKGHALQIIDFSKFVKNDCDYETGEGFPKDKNRGDALTDQEKECCEQKLQEIKEKYKIVQTPQQCMLVSDSVPSFINCMNVYFQGKAEAEQLWEQEKQELLEFDEKYPACSAVGCEFQPLIQIEEIYVSCVQSMDIITWMNSIILCKDTTCEINYKSALMTYKENHLLCDLEEWEKRIPTHDCTIIPPGPKPDPDPDPTPICDENNPNHFPKPGDKDPDMTCCLYFEEKMKLEYSQQGLSQAEIDQKINDWFFEPGKEFRQNCLMKSCDINDTTLTEECCDELMEAYPEYPDEFWIGKGCKPEGNNKCTWRDYAEELIEHLKQMMNADCSIGTSNKLEANDTTNWECIFDSDNITPGTKEEVFRDYYVKYSNPYCAVYCREDVKYDFPNGSMVVKAGNHFTVGETGHEPEWKSVQFSSTRECKTQGSTRDESSEEINTEQFEEDWEEANDKVISTWDDWKIAQQQDWSYANSKKSSKKDCDWRCTKTCTSNGTSYCCAGYYAGYTMYPATVYYARFESSNQNVTPGTWCSTLGHPDPGSAAKAQVHKKAKEDMETIETDIHACTSWDEFDSYRYASLSSTDIKALRYAKYPTYKDFVDYKEFNPDLTIDYDEFTHDEYDYNDLLKKDEKDTIVSDNNFSITGKRYTIKYDCSRDPSAPGKVTCIKRIVFDYSPQKEAHSTYFKEIKYTLQDGVFSTILKPQGTAVNGSESGSSTSQIYIDLGYSALHVHFMTPSGRYDIGLTYPGFTPGGSATGGGFEHNFDKLVEDSYEYDCTYIVHNEIIENDDPNCEGDNCFPCKTDNCDPAGLKGLNLIYRPISLGEPFPGLNGEGREPGSNWNDTSLIENFITKNRGVNGSAIYQKAPMYQITLTPALIQQIRKYNESTTYNDFNMDCTAEGKECKSYFIRGNIEDSSYNFSNYFQTCSISGNRGSSACCGIGNWNDCDDKDGITRR